MSTDTEWSVEKYRTDYESDEHWELRKSFMEAHKERFTEDEIVCMAQVFINVEFLGCKYPNETMETVAALSREIAEDFRKIKSRRLKRTFVEASSAAESKAKRK